MIRPFSDVYWRPTSRFVADFMGGANRFSGQVRSEAGTAVFQTASGWTLPLGGGPAQGGEAQLCVRPESVEVARPGAEAPTRRVGTIVEVVPLGPTRQLLIELTGGERVLASEPNRVGRLPSRGDAVAVASPPSACTLFPASA